jgi:N-acetylneuraminic acid mutarotase
MDSVSWTDRVGNLWLFGGSGFFPTGTSFDLDDLWEFNPTAKTWTWVSGSVNSGNAHGVYGTMGTAAASVFPGARTGSVSWTDGSGNLWLFGGTGYDSTGTGGLLNDLWEFNPTAKTWTWVSGSNTTDALPVYGTMGTAAASNVPGARYGSASWTDGSGNLWLFGGTGIGSPLAGGGLNDLWMFNPTAKIWTWVSGSSAVNTLGVYGTMGTASANNVPGSRSNSLSWTDGSGNLWLFGGLGYGSSGAWDYLGDLWEFNPTAKTWTWVSGSNTTDALPVYGTLGVASTSNVPGARMGSVSWTDGSGNLWLFGGSGIILPGTGSPRNDLWMFNPTAKTWTWVSGSNTTDALPVYGTMGTAAASNVPGARMGSVSWADSMGNLWLFGGSGYDSTGTGGDDLNDLWRYQP